MPGDRLSSFLAEVDPPGGRANSSRTRSSRLSSFLSDVSTPPPDEGPGLIGRTLNRARDFGRQFARGTQEGALVSAAGLSKLVPDAMLPEGSRLRNEAIDRSLEREREELRGDWGDPEGTAGTVGSVAGRVAFEGAAAVTAGGIARKAVPALGAWASGSTGRRIASDLVADAPINLAISAAGPRESTAGALAELLAQHRRGAKETTRLTPEREKEFQQWAQGWGISDVDHPASRYDYRGAFLASVGSEIHPLDGLPHWPDTFKQHGHPTFSEESQYSRGPGDGGTWEGEQFTPGARRPLMDRIAANPVARGAFEVATGGAGSALLHGGAAGVRHVADVMERASNIGSEVGRAFDELTSADFAPPAAAVNRYDGAPAMPGEMRRRLSRPALPPGPAPREVDPFIAGPDGVRQPLGMRKQLPAEVRDAEGVRIPDQTTRLGERSILAAPVSGEGGFAAPELVSAFARAGGGGAIGAGVDASQGDDGAWEGALLGAGGAAAAPALLRGGRGVLRNERGALGAVEEGTRSRLSSFLDDVEPNPDTDPGDLLNLSKLALDTGGEEHVGNIVRRLVSAGEASTKPVTWEETQALAKQMGLHPHELAAGSGKGRRSGAEMLAMREVVNRDVSALQEATRRLADTTLPAEERDQLMRTVTGLDDRISAVTGRLVRSSQEAGRDLNALKIQANTTRDPAYWLSKAQRVLGGPLPIERRTELLRVLNTGTPVEIARHVQGLRKSGAGEKAASFLKAGMLTGPATHVANLVGNTTMALVREVESVPAFILDRLISPLTGLETKANPLTSGLQREAMRGAIEGTKKAARMMGLPQARDALREGRGLKGAAGEMAAEIRAPELGHGNKFQEGNAVNYDSALLDTYVKSVFRTLSAEDAIFRGAALQRSLQEQAALLARREGLKGEARAARVAELMKRPPDEIATAALEAAEYATFQRSTALGDVGAAVKRTAWQAGQAPGFVAEMTLPFSRTPAAIITTMSDYSPLGALTTVPDLVRLAKRATRGTADAKLQRSVVEGLTRAGVGTTAIYLGAYLSERGLMTAGYPTDEAERQRWKLEGKQPNSVLVDGKWQSLNQVSPMGNLLAVGAHLHHIRNDPELSGLGKAERAALAGLNVAGEAPFLRGVSDLGAAVRDREGDTAGRYVRGKVGVVVPSAVGAAARATDPYVREQTGVLDGAISRVPGLSRTLPEKLDPLGRPVERDEGMLSSLANPLRPSKDRRDDPVVGELARLGQHVPQLSQDRKGGETDEAYHARQMEEGRTTYELLAEMFNSEDYRSIPDQVAELVATDPEYAGEDPEALTQWLQKERASDLISDIRREYTRQRREALTTQE